MRSNASSHTASQFHIDIARMLLAWRSRKMNVALREIDVLRVKGQNTSVAIYEVLDHYSADQFPQMNDVLRCYLTGYIAMRKRDWKAAQQSVSEALQLHPGDKPSKTHLERIGYYIERPPADDWDGVWVMTSK